MISNTLYPFSFFFGGSKMEVPEWRVEVLQVTAELEKLKEEHNQEWAEFIAEIREYGVIAEKLARLARKQRFWQLVREARRARDRLRLRI